jgi:uncharacterized protein YbjQ (UPF0145 family)
VSILITTTDNVEGKRIARYLGIVTGEASAEVQLVSDKPVASFSDAYHKVIPGARDSALRGAMQGAEQAGANAIVGTKVEYHIHGGGRGMVLVSVTGTAVLLEDVPPT